jgi:hypothetical protein
MMCLVEKNEKNKHGWWVEEQRCVASEQCVTRGDQVARRRDGARMRFSSTSTHRHVNDRKNLFKLSLSTMECILVGAMERVCWKDVAACEGTCKAVKR